MHLADNRQKLEQKLLTKLATVADLTLDAAVRLIDDDNKKDGGFPVFAAYDSAEKALLTKLRALPLNERDEYAQRTIKRFGVVAEVMRKAA